jgi:DNA-binding transcriptional LysR family regulator
MRHLYDFKCVDAIAKAGSIRKAADSLAITPSALNRRLLALEAELGTQLFERLPRGVRLSTAGELMIQHIRDQVADFERLQSQIADLSGIRRGHVNIACSQALLPYFLPREIERYRSEHPGVTFSVSVRDREAAEQALLDYSADVALIFEPVRLADCQTMVIVEQPIRAVMSPDHPLTGHRTLKLEDMLAFPLAMPMRPYGVRSLLDAAAARKNLRLAPAVEAESFEFLRHVVLHGPAIAFQIAVGLPAEGGRRETIVTRPIHPRDVPPGRLHLAQLKGRSLPVAAARFAMQLQAALSSNFTVLG